MYKGRSSKIFPIIIVILVVALVIAAVVSLGQMLFSGSSSNKEATDVSRSALLDTGSDAHVVMNVRGPLVANENLRTYQIDISPMNRTMTTYRGYNGEQLNNRQLSNNTTAYEEFVYALDRDGFMTGTPLQDDKNDTRGVCANGRLYEFAVMRGNRTVKQLWTTTCSGSRGSLRANREQVQRLFERQIPDSQTLLRDLSL